MTPRSFIEAFAHVDEFDIIFLFIGNHVDSDDVINSFHEAVFKFKDENSRPNLKFFWINVLVKVYSILNVLNFVIFVLVMSLLIIICYLNIQIVS